MLVPYLLFPWDIEISTSSHVSNGLASGHQGKYYGGKGGELVAFEELKGGPLDIGKDKLYITIFSRG